MESVPVYGKDKISISRKGLGAGTSECKPLVNPPFGANFVENVCISDVGANSNRITNPLIGFTARLASYVHTTIAISLNHLRAHN